MDRMNFNGRRRSTYTGPTGRWLASLSGCYRYCDPNGPLYWAAQSGGKASVLRMQIEEVHFSYAKTPLPLTTYPSTTLRRSPLTTYDLPLTTYHLRLTTYHLRLTTYDLPLTTYDLPLNPEPLNQALIGGMAADHNAVIAGVKFPVVAGLVPFFELFQGDGKLHRPGLSISG